MSEESPSQQPAPRVVIYTDGGASPNPGPGGWGVVWLHQGREPEEKNGGVPRATNNQMELQAAIEALSHLAAPHRVELYTDSQYLRRGITEFLARWERNGWVTQSKQPVKNVEQWKALARLAHRHDVTWHWVKGHQGNRWNERVDQLATQAIERPALPLDDESAIHVFTAASYLGSTKVGSWACLLRFGEHEKVLSGTEENSSGNRMHLVAAIEGLRAIKKRMPIHLYTTASYAKDGATQWLPGWLRRGFQTKSGDPVKHRELWEALASALERTPARWHVVDKKELPEPMKRARQRSQETARGTQQPEAS